MKVSIWTRDKKTDDEHLNKVMNKAIEKLPDITIPEFEVIHHDDNCKYRGFEVNDL
jgi:hypothetical protein